MSAAARYIARAPRYVFRPGDQTLMRFAAMETRGISSRARVRDLSASGISFWVNSADAPFEKEMLKLEFGLPGSRQVAWYAVVTRVEERVEWDPELGQRAQILIALKFDNMPESFVKALKKSLDGRVKDDDDSAIDPMANTPKQILSLIGMGLLCSLAMALMSLPPDLWIKPLRSLF